MQLDKNRLWRSNENLKSSINFNLRSHVIHLAVTSVPWFERTFEKNHFPDCSFSNFRCLQNMVETLFKADYFFLNLTANNLNFVLFTDTRRPSGSRFCPEVGSVPPGKNDTTLDSRQTPKNFSVRYKLLLTAEWRKTEKHSFLFSFRCSLKLWLNDYCVYFE